ncbi:hypothetical protein ABVK25_007840 [Lepraria finkii]|uniref:U1-type domain-containing protein n=1 Tax=Lepraria finkii TaxID=1340010 RepID=A0ABR4B2F7_9LECA
MSEYWKSTPKYWCKHCKIFVRDTKLEKTNHEATPKHQGNLKRFLRDLHKGHELEERDKQRAKDEVDRLNGVLSGSGSKAPPWKGKSVRPAPTASMQATPADRKKQLAQLVELGVAVPEDFRKEMAMAGDWQTTSQRLIYDTVKEKEVNEDVKTGGLNIGVRKRKFESQEEEAAGETVVRRGWGSTIRTYPGIGGDGDDDLDTLLKTTKALKSGGGIMGRTGPTDGSSQPEQSAELSGEKGVQPLHQTHRESSAKNLRATLLLRRRSQSRTLLEVLQLKRKKMQQRPGWYSRNARRSQSGRNDSLIDSYTLPRLFRIMSLHEPIAAGPNLSYR